MSRIDGIAETISDFLSEKKIELASDELQQLVEDIDHGVSMWNEMSYGHIPNPLSSEVDRVQKLRKADDMEHGREVERLRSNIEDWRRECRRLEWKLQDARAAGFRD